MRLSIKNTKKTIQQEVLFHHLDFECNTGQMVFLCGESGCGKTTLLHMIAGYDKDYEGEITFETINEQKQTKESKIPFEKIGFVYQDFHLIDGYTNLENIVLFHTYDQEVLAEIVQNFSLTSLLNKYPHEISGGEKQRIGLARTLLKNPAIILCDEPTSSIDENQAEFIMKLLRKQAEKSIVIVASHARQFAREYADIMVELPSGNVEKFQRNYSLETEDKISSNITRKFALVSFITVQAKMYWRRIMHYLLPLFLLTIATLCILIGFGFYRGFVDKIAQEKKKRIDAQYIMLYGVPQENKTEIVQELSLNIEEEITPYYELLNNQIVSYFYLYNQERKFQNFYFEIVVLVDVVPSGYFFINQLFFQKCLKQIDAFYMQIHYQQQEYHLNYPIKEVIEDGLFYNVPRLYIGYDQCQQIWPTYTSEVLSVYYVQKNVEKTQQLLLQHPQFVAKYLPHDSSLFRYDYSTYLLSKLQYDLTKTLSPLLWLIIGVFALLLSAILHLIFYYLFDVHRPEYTLWKAEGYTKTGQAMILLSDVLFSSILAYVVAIILMLVFLALPSSYSFSQSTIKHGIILAALFLFLHGGMIGWRMFFSVRRISITEQWKENQGC